VVFWSGHRNAWVSSSYRGSRAINQRNCTTGLSPWYHKAVPVATSNLHSPAHQPLVWLVNGTSERHELAEGRRTFYLRSHEKRYGYAKFLRRNGKMATVELETYRVAAPFRWGLQGALIIGTAIKIWPLLFALHSPSKTIFLVTLTIFVLWFLPWLVLRKTTTTALLDGDNRNLRKETRLLGYVIRQHVVDLSRYSWVRARLSGEEKTFIIIEAGNSGFETYPFVLVPYGDGDGVEKSTALSARAAAILKMDDKGYCGLA